MKHVEDVFNVHRILQARRNGISAEELCERTGCSASGLKRTLAFLRDALHAPLIFDAARGGYRTACTSCRDSGSAPKSSPRCS